MLVNVRNNFTHSTPSCFETYSPDYSYVLHLLGNGILDESTNLSE